MSKTEIVGSQIKDATIQRADLDTTTSGQAVVAKVVAGSNINLSSTGVDAGTGDVTINLDSSVTDNISDLQSDISTLQSDVSALQSATTALNDLTDVTIATPSTNQVLTYTGAEWQNAAAPAGFSGDYNDLTNKPSFTLSGLSGFSISSPTSGQFLAYNGSAWANTSTIQASGAAVKPLVLKGAASQTANLFELQDNSGNVLFEINASGQVEAPTTTTPALVVRGIASQTANLFEAQNSAGTAQFTISPAGLVNGMRFGPGPGGNNNTVFGVNAGNALTTGGDNNTAFGNGALSAVTTGYDNTGVGLNAGSVITTGYENVIVGSGATVGSATAFRNVAVGAGANGGTSNNVAIGRNATVGAASSNSIAIGNGANTTGSNAIAIGNGASAAASCLNIAGVLFGDSSGRVGLGTSTPTAQFQVTTLTSARGVVTFQGANAQNASLINCINNAGTSQMSVSAIGNVTAKRFSEGASNSFDTVLSVSASGVLTIDGYLTANILGTLNDSVTTWAFTNIMPAIGYVTTVRVILQGNPSYSYGDACTVNGVAITNGIRWAGGVAPTPSSGIDILTFTVLRDNQGSQGAYSVIVFGSATTNFS